MIYYNNLILLINLFFFSYKLILGIIFFFLIYLLLPFTRLKICSNSFFKFKDFEIIEKIFSFFVVFCLFSIIIIILLFRRIINFNNSLDLVDIFFNIQIYCTNSTYFEIFSTIFFCFSILLLYLILLKCIKKYFFIHFFKIHILFLSKEIFLHREEYSNVILKETPKSYFYFIEKYNNFFNILEGTFFNIIKLFLPILIGEDSTIEDKYFKIECRLIKKVEYLFIYSLIFSLFYDIIFNFCYITKIFYIFPFAFVYYLLYTFRWFSSGNYDKNFMSVEACIELSFFYYVELIKIETNKENDGDIIYYFSNGYFCSKKRLKDILNLMYKMND